MKDLLLVIRNMQSFYNVRGSSRCRLQRNIYIVLFKLILMMVKSWFDSLCEARVGEPSRQRLSISQFWTCSLSYAPRQRCSCSICLFNDECHKDFSNYSSWTFIWRMWKEICCGMNGCFRPMRDGPTFRLWVQVKSTILPDIKSPV